MYNVGLQDQNGTLDFGEFLCLMFLWTAVGSYQTIFTRGVRCQYYPMMIDITLFEVNVFLKDISTVHKTHVYTQIRVVSCHDVPYILTRKFSQSGQCTRSERCICRYSGSLQNVRQRCVHMYVFMGEHLCRCVL